MIEFTKAQHAMLEKIKNGGNIQPLKCPTVMALIRRGVVSAYPTAFGFGQLYITETRGIGLAGA